MTMPRAPKPVPRPPHRSASGRAAAALALATALLAAAPALAVDERPPARRELVPTGARATIQLGAAESAEDTVHGLHMEKGKSVFVRTDYGVGRVSVGDARIADVIVLRPQEIQLVARDVGSTNVVIWGNSGEIEAAIDLDVGRPYSAVESEIRRLAETDDVRVDSAGDSIVLSGSVPNAETLERVLALARAHFPDKEAGQVVNMLSVGGNQQVLIEVTVSEMSRELRRAIGTNFAAQIVNGGNSYDVFNLLDGLTSLNRTINDAGVVKDMIDFSQQVNLISSAAGLSWGAYTFFVNVLDETGLGKVLAEPTLVARAGETASFLAGGEVPIPVAQGGAFGSITIEYHPFGVAVSFTPTVMSDQRIHLDVSTEVSEVDFGLGTAVAGLTAPGFRTRRASTGVELGDGQVFAIAGLLQDQMAERVAKYPILGSIPILGTLFRSSSYQKKLTELVLLVRPRLVKPIGPEPPPLPTDYLDEPNWFEFFLLGRAEGFDDQYPVEKAEARAGMIGDAGYRLPASPAEGEDERP